MKLFKTDNALESLNTKLFWLLLIIFSGIVAVGVGITLLTIYYGKPVGDDFLAIHDFGISLWLQNTVHYLINTARYGQSIAGSILYGIFQNRVGVFLPLMVIFWLGSLFFMYISKIEKALALNIAILPRILISSTFIFIAIFVNKTVDPGGTWFAYQDFFFSSAIVTYTLPLLLLLTLAYVYVFIVKRPLSRISLVYLGMSLYALGLFNEVQPITIIEMSGLLIILGIIQNKGFLFNKLKALRLPLIIAITSSLLALLTMYFSPANQQRRMATGGMVAGGKYEAILHTINYTLSSLYFRPSDLVLIISFSIVCFIAYKIYVKKNSLKSLPVAMGVGVFMLFSFLISLCTTRALLVYGYGPSVGVLPRTLLIPQLLYVTGIFITSFCCLEFIFSKIKKEYSSFFMLALSLGFIIALVFLIPKYMHRIDSQIENAVGYSNAWITQDSILKEKARTNPSQTIYLPDAGAGIGDGFSLRCTGPYVQNTIWLTEGIETYYGVKEVCAESDLKQ